MKHLRIMLPVWAVIALLILILPACDTAPLRTTLHSTSVAPTVARPTQRSSPTASPVPPQSPTALLRPATSAPRPLTPTPVPGTIASIAGIWEGPVSIEGGYFNVPQQIKYEIRTACSDGNPCVILLTDLQDLPSWKTSSPEMPFDETESRGNAFCFSSPPISYCFDQQADGTAALRGDSPMWAMTGILARAGTTVVGVTPSPYAGTVRSIEYVGKIETEASKVDFVRQFAFVGAFGRKLKSYDVSDPADPIELAFPEGRGGNDFAITEKYIYLVDDSSIQGVTLYALDTSNLRGYWKSFPYGDMVHGWDIRAADDRIYFLDSKKKVHILDFPKPQSRELGTFTISENINKNVSDFAIAGNFAYILVYSDGLHIVDVSDPKSVHEVGFLALPGTTTHLAVADQFVYIAAQYDGLHIIDVSNPGNPLEVGPYGAKTKYIETVNVVGRYTYLYVDTDHIEVVDISNPLAPTLVASTNFHGVSSINVKDNYMYVAAGNDGVSIYLLKE